MPRVCTVCTHPKRSAIDRALIVASTPNRRIATRYGLSESSVRRHRAEHIPAMLVKAEEAATIAEAGTLLQQVEALRDRSLQLLTKAEEAGDLRTALAGVREARACIELLLEVEGELDRRNVTNTIISPEWVSIRTVIVVALEGHPDAAQTVAGALHALDAANPS